MLLSLHGHDFVVNIAYDEAACPCRFGIPFGLATSLGLAVRALDLPLTVTEAGDGELLAASYLSQIDHDPASALHRAGFAYA